MAASSTTTSTTPKQTTEEIGHWSEPVTLYHREIAEAMLDYNYLTSDFSRGLRILDLVTQFTPKPLTSSNMDTQVFLGVTNDGYVKVRGGLPPKEYEILVGKKNWKSISQRYANEKYKVYDDKQKKDSATQLYPEFELMFRPNSEGVGCYLKVSWAKEEDDGRPELTVDMRSLRDK